MHRNVIVAHRTDTGLERSENQDAYGYWYDEASDCYLLVVADGMGGMACGSIASRLAVRVIYERFFAEAERYRPVNERLGAAIVEANLAIRRQAASNQECYGMGSTCAVLAVTGGRAHLAHVGDSRIYLIRDHRIARLTRDHSRVQRMLDDGLITEEEAMGHPDSNLIERSLGPRPAVEPEVRPEPIEVREGDAFLLCTDGLTGLVRDEEIFEIISSVPAQRACDLLIELANERGGHDNITVGILRLGEEVTLAF
jgi:serine/threonine protein phosphatase PrpC